MHRSDLAHDNHFLEAKLKKIFQLRRTRSKVNWDQAQYLELLKSLGNPHKNLPPIIHVAGTNGKGSIIAILRAILEAQGMKVHCYTSPHLIHMNERIVLAGKEIDDKYLEQLIDQTLEYNKGTPLSFFEITTALAFKAFADNLADILLLEVGMGGRLDCTNVIDAPLVSIINRISLDHTDFLGKNVAEIAAEKAGIMRANTPCIVGYQGDNSIIKVIKNAAKTSSALLQINGEDWNISDYNFPAPSLLGAHQMQNAGVALTALFAIQDKIKVSREAITKGLKSVKWRGRLQNIPTAPFNVDNNTQIWLDCGHNDSAGEVLATQIKKWDRPVHLVIGMIDKKDSKGFLTPLLPHISSLNIVPISSEPSSKTKNDIAPTAHSYNNVITAIKSIAKQSPSEIILIVGSVYLAGEVLNFIDEK